MTAKLIVLFGSVQTVCTRNHKIPYDILVPSLCIQYMRYVYNYFILKFAIIFFKLEKKLGKSGLFRKKFFRKIIILKEKNAFIRIAQLLKLNMCHRVNTE